MNKVNYIIKGSETTATLQSMEDVQQRWALPPSFAKSKISKIFTAVSGMAGVKKCICSH